MLNFFLARTSSATAAKSQIRGNFFGVERVCFRAFCACRICVVCRLARRLLKKRGVAVCFLRVKFVANKIKVVDL